MKRSTRKRLLHRIGMLLESDLDTEGLWEEVPDENELEDVKAFMLCEADKFFRRSDAIEAARAALAATKGGG